MLTIPAWYKKPYSPDMDVGQWVLFIIFVLVVIAGWAHTVHFIARSVE